MACIGFLRKLPWNIEGRLSGGARAIHVSIILPEDNRLHPGFADDWERPPRRGSSSVWVGRQLCLLSSLAHSCTSMQFFSRKITSGNVGTGVNLWAKHVALARGAARGVPPG